MATIDVQSYGATLSDSSNDRVAINNAIAASAIDDTVLLSGTGYYYTKGTDFVTAQSGRIYRCAPGAWLRRDETSSNPSTMVNCPSVKGAAFHSFRLDLESTANFRKGLYFLNFEDVEAIGCEFNDTGTINSEWTPMGILAQIGDRIRVERCTFNDTQCKLGGGAGGLTGVVFIGNTSNRPRQYAVSAVARNEGAVVRGVLIRDCSIVDPAGAGGIYIGDDTEDSSEVEDMTFSDITVENVDVTGTWRDDADSQIKIVNGRPYHGSENWVFRNVSGIADNATEPNQSQGFVFFPRNRRVSGIPALRGLFMRDCYVENVELWGLRIASQIEEIDIDNMEIVGGMGVDIRSQSIIGPRGRIRCEINGGGAFEVRAQYGNVGPLYVQTNAEITVIESNGYTANVIREPWSS